MRSWERLRKMKAFYQKELCEGRSFKSPKPQTGKNAQYGPLITDFTMAEPRVFLGWQPMRPDEPGKVFPDDPTSVCPAITIMPSPSLVRYVEEHRFDRYNNIHRPQEMGQSLIVSMLFTIYEPGIRMPGFVESLESGKPDMSLLKDGTEEGVMTVMEWMDDAKELILRERHIPGTDLVLEDDNMVYGFYTDQQYIADRRPLYYGYINVEWKCHADTGNDHGKPTAADRLLDGID